MDSEDSSSDEETTLNTKRKKPQANGAPNKKRKLPTAQERHELYVERAQSLFGLELEELLKETRVKHKHVSEFQEFLTEFAQALDQLPSLDKKPKSKLDKIIGKNTYLEADKELIACFSKPEEKVQVFGSGDELKPIHYDVNVVMPKAYFNVKDYFDNRYFVRRHWYLIYLTQALKGRSLAWESFAGCSLLPVLKVKLNKVLVRIHATPPTGYFNLGRALPSTKNVRSGNHNNQYNSALGRDLTLFLNNKAIADTLNGLSNIKKAMKLVRIWLEQRELVEDVIEDVISYFFAYLVKQHTVTEHMDLVQIVRNFWQFTKNLVKSSGLWSETSSAQSCKTSNLDQFSDPFVFLDTTGYYNVLSLLSPDKFKKLQSECEIALNLVEKSALFPLFISKVYKELQFDMMVVVNEAGSKDVPENILQVLKKGLNKRARLVVPYTEKQEWSWNSLPHRTGQIRFGINLDPGHAFELVERGPELHEVNEAAEFRTFWGNLAEDRRFKDSTFAVAVVFDAVTIKSRREIVKKMVDFLLTDKCNVHDYRLIYDSVEEALMNKKISPPYPMGTNEEACLLAIKTSDELGRILKRLDLPLPISSIRPVSDVHSCSAVFPPIATSFHINGKITNVGAGGVEFNVKKPGFVPRYIEPIECVIQFEDSSKWINSVKGVQHMKVDLFLTIQRLLKEKRITSTISTDYMDVLYKGLVFRYSTFVHKEVGLLMKQVENNGTVKYKNTIESLNLKKRYDLTPKIISALGGVKDQFPCYGPSSALIKRWLRCHMIDSHMFPDMAIDLVNASLFLSPQSPFLPPCSPQIAFLRFLRFIVEFKWQSQAITVDFNETLSDETIEEVEATMTGKTRPELPNLYIVTAFDQDLRRSPFTKHAPSPQVLAVTKRIADKTYRQILDGFPVEKIFKPAAIDKQFDLVIHLRPLVNPRRHEQIVDGPEHVPLKLEAVQHKSEKCMPIVGHDPVQIYLRELREQFSDVAVFFHDTYGGNAIGVLRTPETSDDQLDQLTEDFYHLGRSVVKSIDKK